MGDKEYPLALDSAGTNLAALQGGARRHHQGPVLLQLQRREGLRAAEDVGARRCEKADLVVTIDVQMSETALQSDYVLPEVTYLERLELPEFIGGKKHFVGMRTRGARQACIPRRQDLRRDLQRPGRGLRRGRVLPVHRRGPGRRPAGHRGRGPRRAEARRAWWSCPTRNFEYGTPKFKTPSGKFEFSSEAVGAAGLNPVIGCDAAQGHAEGGRVRHRGRQAGHPLPHHDAEHRRR